LKSVQKNTTRNILSDQTEEKRNFVDQCYRNDAKW